MTTPIFRRLEPLDCVLDATLREVIGDDAVFVDTPYGPFIFSADSVDIGPGVCPGSRVTLFVRPDGVLAVRKFLGGCPT